MAPASVAKRVAAQQLSTTAASSKAPAFLPARAPSAPEVSVVAAEASVEEETLLPPAETLLPPAKQNDVAENAFEDEEPWGPSQGDVAIGDAGLVMSLPQASVFICSMVKGEGDGFACGCCRANFPWSEVHNPFTIVTGDIYDVLTV